MHLLSAIITKLTRISALEYAKAKLFGPLGINTTFWARHLRQSQSILGVRFKRRAHRIPEYLDRSEIQSLFVQIDCRTVLGQRDDALFRMLYNTGMKGAGVG